MRRPTLIFAALVGAALFLSACDFRVEVPVRQPDVTVGTGSSSARQSLSVPARRDLLVRVDLTDAARQADLVYIELDAAMELEVYDSRRTLIGSSASPAFFGPGRTGLTTAALESQAIGASVRCRGSCVIVEPAAARGNHLYALVSNPGAARTVGLYAFGDQYEDLSEPFNDSPEEAPIVDEMGVQEGAIETIGDVDHWRVTIDADLAFDSANPALDLVLWVITPADLDDLGPIEPGSPAVSVFRDDVIVVESRTDRAGPSGESVYYLDFH